MSEPNPAPLQDRNLAREVARKSARKLKARRHRHRGALSGFAFFGLIGWSVVLPTLLGTALGAWIDSHHESRFTWTLMLMVLGLVAGCWNAWRWIQAEHREIEREQRGENDDD